MGALRVDRVGVVTLPKPAGDLPDLERIRRNWARGAPLPDDGPNRLSAVATPRDPYEAGRALIETLEREVEQHFASHAEVLRPFLERVRRVFYRMSNAAESTDAPKSEDLKALREGFMIAIRDIEDLCEVFAVVNR